MQAKFSLGFKVSSVVLAFTLLGSALFGYFTIHDAHEHAYEQVKDHITLLAQILSAALIEPVTHHNYAAIEQTLTELIHQSQAIYSIQVTDVDNRLISSVSQPFYKTGLTVTCTQDILATDYSKIGGVTIRFINSPTAHIMGAHFPNIVLFATAMILLGGLLLMVSMRKLIITPIKTLALQAEAIAQGQMNTTITSLSRDEVGMLATNLEAMRQHLQSSYQEIKQQNALLDQRVEERTQELQRKNSELEQMHGQLVQSEKMASVGLLAAGIAHEVNNPVGYVSSNLKTLEEYTDGLDEVIRHYEEQDPFLQDHNRYEAIANEKTIQGIEQIRDDLPDVLYACREGVQRIGDITRELMAFSRRDNNEWHWTNIHQCIDSTLKLVQGEIKHTASIKKHYGELPPVYCIPSQISQVLLNLILNACQAMEGKKGEINLTTEITPQWVKIKVADTGKGVTTDNQHKIFEPFFTTKAIGEGTGLGLAVCYGIIKRHRGDIYLDPTYQKGCCFIIKIPNKAAQKEKPKSQKTNSPAPVLDQNA